MNMKAVATVVFAIITLLEAEQAGYNIRPIPQTGVLFEHLGKANFYAKHWTILSELKMPDLTEDLEFANNCSSLITQLCIELNHTGIVSRCTVAAKEITSWVEKIRRQDEELSHHTQSESARRSRRSFFDGVGSLAKTLFGTMDHADSEEIHAALDDLSGKENRTFNLLKEQITVMKSTFDLFNASRTQAAAEREELWKKVLAIVNAQQGQHRELSSLQLRVDLSEVITLMTLHLREISEMQETMTSILVSLSIGKLHPSIIHAREMTDIISNVTRKLELDEKFKDFQLLMQIAKVQAIQVKGSILVRIEIPQPNRVSFDLYKVYTIPVSMDENSYHIFELNTEFVAANNHERQYLLLDHSQYQKCQQLLTTASHQQLLCPQLSPIMTAIGDNCVLNLYRSFNVNTKACREKVIPKWDSLTRMVTRNHWLFVMAKKTKLEVNCQDLPTAIGELSATGILTIEEHCHLQIGDQLIASEDNAQRNISLWQPTRSELPSWGSITTLAKPSQAEPTEREVRLLVADNFNQQWRDQEATIKKVQDDVQFEENNRQKIHPHHIHLTATSLSGCISIFSLALAAGALIKLKRWRRDQVRMSTSRTSILPTSLNSSKHPRTSSTEQPLEEGKAKTSIEVIVPSTANLPTSNLPTIVGKQLVQLE